MKNLVFIILISMSVISYGQSKKQLKTQVAELSAKNQELQTQLGKQKRTTDSIFSANFTMKEHVRELETKVEECQNSLTRIREAYLKSNTKEEGSDASKTSAETKKCIATTASGNRCSRNAEAGGDYCWQHKNSAKTNTESTKPSSSSSYDGGRTIHTGPRGGKYYINSKGNKVYVH